MSPSRASASRLAGEIKGCAAVDPQFDQDILVARARQEDYAQAVEKLRSLQARRRSEPSGKRRNAVSRQEQKRLSDFRKEILQYC